MPSPTRSTIGNLPLERGSSFVGRRREAGALRQLLAKSRLVTVTGPAGVGKTRLALRAAGGLHRSFPHGIWFIDLIELSHPGLSGEPDIQDPDLLAFQVAARLRLPGQPGGPPVRWLAEQIANRRMLLVLDNCEHLISACVVLVNGLLRGCPGLRILATSREAMVMSGEAIFPVPPLPTPQLGDRTNLAALARYPSVALFVSRAKAVLPSFGLTAGNQDAVAELCRRLDGLPLAIELAAARIPTLTPQEILNRLTDRFALLTSDTMVAPQRQRTLRACVDWSFALCTKLERLLWARLSVFVGGFELEAVEGICADDELPEADVLDLVAGLVEKSILVWDYRDPQARYRMLETIRDYGRERLIEAGEQTVLRRRHRDWYQRLMAHARNEWTSSRQPYWLARLAREHPNLRAAVEYSLTDPGQAENALQMLVSVPPLYWWAHGLISEGRAWLARALTQATPSTALHARALVLASRLAVWQGDIETARRQLDEGQDLALRFDDPAALAHARLARGQGTLLRNDPAGAVEFLEQGLTILSEPAVSELDLRLHLLMALGASAALTGDEERAIACQREMLAITQPRGEISYQSWAMWLRGLAAWRHGKLQEATEQEIMALRLKQRHELDDPYGTAQILEVLAWTAANQQRHERAATLLGATDALWGRLRTPITSLGHLSPHHHECERQARAVLGDTAFADALRHGQTLPPEDALAYAINDQP